MKVFMFHLMPWPHLPVGLPHVEQPPETAALIVA